CSVVKPLEALNFVIAFFDLIDAEGAPAAVGRVSVGPRCLAIGIAAIAALELREVCVGERPGLLGDGRNVGPSIVDPDLVGRSALSEEDDVSLGGWSIRIECSVWAA